MQKMSFLDMCCNRACLLMRTQAPAACTSTFCCSSTNHADICRKSAAARQGLAEQHITCRLTTAPYCSFRTQVRSCVWHLCTTCCGDILPVWCCLIVPQEPQPALVHHHVRIPSRKGRQTLPRLVQWTAASGRCRLCEITIACRCDIECLEVAQWHGDNQGARECCTLSAQPSLVSIPDSQSVSRSGMLVPNSSSDPDVAHLACLQLTASWFCNTVPAHVRI